MTQPSSVSAPSRFEALSVYLRPSVLVVILLGFSSGLPLALTGTTLSVWMTESGVNLGTIGLFSLVGLPYTLKFLWAPVVDAIDVPFLSRRLGRRRGWLLATQIALVAAILFLGFQDPAHAPFLVALGALLLATASATQDIVVDAFRVERLDTSEQAAGMAGYVAAYRIGMLVSGAGVIAIVAAIEVWGVPRDAVWRWGYVAAAAFMGVGMAATFMAREPEPPPARDGAEEGAVRRVAATAYGAFAEFLARPQALVILLFVLLFKFADAFAGVLTAPFVIAIGFDKATYAAIVKGVGLAAALAGGFAGGAMARALAARHLSVDRRHPPDAVQPRLLRAGDDRGERALPYRQHRGGEFLRRHRHCGVRGLSLGAVRRAGATPPRNMRCSPRSPPWGAPSSLPGAGSSRRKPAGRCSSSSQRSPAFPA